MQSYSLIMHNGKENMTISHDRTLDMPLPPIYRRHQPRARRVKTPLSPSSSTHRAIFLPFASHRLLRHDQVWAHSAQSDATD